MTTLEEERRELWDGLLDGLRDSGDPDCAAACRRLLRHLLLGPSPGIVPNVRFETLAT
jgi:hypothetical protein